ncbi:MAG: WD40 repeat domain-containing protein [Planctomycetaceae bacterium]
MRVLTLGLIGLALLAVPAVADDPAKTDAAAASDVWVTSLASGTMKTEAGEKAVSYAGFASGLLLQPAEVVRWEGDDFASRTPIMTHPAAVWCVQVCDDNDHVASTDYRGNLQIFDVAAAKATMHEGVFERWTQAMRFVPGGESIVAGNEAGKLFVWEDGKIAKSVEVDKNAITDIAFNHTTDRIAVSDGGGTIHLFSWPALEPDGKIKISDAPAWCVRFGKDSATLLVGSGDRNLYRCEAKDGAKAEPLMQASDWMTRLAVSPTGTIAASEVGGKVFVLASEQPAEPKPEPAATAPSGIWAIHWASPTRLLIGTRKHGVVALAQSWSLAAAPAPKPAAEKPATETPAAEKPADEKPADEKPAAEKPAEAAPADKPAPAEKPGE